MDIDDFPFNEFIKELLGEGETQTLMLPLVEKIRLHIGAGKEGRQIKDDEIKMFVGILKAYIELGCVKENITNVQAGDGSYHNNLVGIGDPDVRWETGSSVHYVRVRNGERSDFKN